MRDPSTREIPLTRGKAALVDAEDYDRLMDHPWQCDSRGYACYSEYHGYFEGKSKRRFILMHRVILGLQTGQETDHINRNRLDNRKSNLRIVDRSENMRNKGDYKNNTTGYRGVHQLPSGNWRARIRYKGEQIYLGVFSTIKRLPLPIIGQRLVISVNSPL
jgi:hypothetical protein